MRPAQAKCFTTAQPCGEQHQVEGFQPITADDIEQHACFLRCEHPPLWLAVIARRFDQGHNVARPEPKSDRLLECAAQDCPMERDTRGRYPTAAQFVLVRLDVLRLQLSEP